MPLMPNGKIDKKSMPSPFSQSRLTDDHEPPVSEAERALAALWQDVIGVDKVGRHDNFFDLGGHSLLAMQIVARARAELEMNISLRMLVSDTLSQIVGQFQRHEPDDATSSMAEEQASDPQRKSGKGILQRIKSKVFTS